jgi:hypothetical protein
MLLTSDQKFKNFRAIESATGSGPNRDTFDKYVEDGLHGKQLLRPEQTIDAGWVGRTVASITTILPILPRISRK